VQSGHGCVKEEGGNDQRAGHFSRQPRHHGHNPEQLRENANVKSGDGEEMQRPGFLKRLFNVFGRLVAQSQHDPAEKTLDVWRVVQTATKRILQPRPRVLRRTQNRIAATVAKHN
jgi:hypothetical protein